MSVNADLMSHIFREDIKALEEMRKAGIDVFHIESDLPCLIFTILANQKLLTMIEWFLKNGANINEQDKNGDTALISAIRGVLSVNSNATNGSLLNIIVSHPVINLLLQYGPDVNLVNNDGESALYYASRNGLVDLVKTLLKLGAGVKTAIKLGDETRLNLYKPEILNILIDAGLLQHLTLDDILFLALTIRTNDPDKILLEKILNFCQKNRLFDSLNNRFAFDIVFQEPKLAMEYFLHGVPIDLINSEGQKLVDYASRHAPRVNGSSPVYLALKWTLALIEDIKNKQLDDDELSFLMECGARLDLRVLENYNTPLHVACSLDTEMANILLKWISEKYNAEDQRKFLSQKNRQNKTPLDLALELTNRRYRDDNAAPLIFSFKNLVQPFVDKCAANTMKYISGSDLNDKIDALPKEVKAIVFELDNDFLEFDNSAAGKEFMESAFDRSVESQALKRVSNRSLRNHIWNTFRETLYSKIHETSMGIILDYCEDIYIGGLHYQWSKINANSRNLINFEKERSLESQQHKGTVITSKQ